MKSQVMHVSRTVFIFVFAVITAFSLMPLPQQRAYADDGALVVTQGLGVSAASNVATNATAVKYSGVSVSVHARTQDGGWGKWVGSGATAGSTGGKGLNALQLKLKGLQGLKGSIRYQTYKRGSGWKKSVANGRSTGSTRNVEAVRVKLVGNVAKHYDVLYRTYVSGRGWQPWVKSNAKSGVTGKGLRVNAVQVKLSPKTEEAAGKSVSRVGVRYEARFKTTGWQAWKGDGATAGKSSGSKLVSGFAVKVDAGTLSGGVKYRAYNEGVKWSDWKTSGFAGQSSSRLEAMRVQLTGDIAKRYDVYYRAYCQSAGWLDWAKNGAVAGSTGYNLRLQAFQVKLVRKGADAPGDTHYPTVNLMEKSKVLNGIDIASWQAGINIAEVSADFVIVKSTQGDWYTNPYFREHADATLASGKLLGIYHYADLRGSAKAQAKYFVNSVKPYLGKTMLFLDYEADILDIDGTVNWAKTFMDYVYKKTGVKPLIYLSKNQTRYHDWAPVANKYGLWVAQYPNYDPVYGYLGDPWTDGYGYGAWSAPRMFQYTSQGFNLGGYSGSLDLDKFYGSVLSWRKLSR